MSRLILCAVCGQKANQRKYGGPCTVCGMPLCPKHTYFYADESDPAIGLTRNQQLKILGNGVVPQQAALALSILLQREQVAA